MEKTPISAQGTHPHRFLRDSSISLKNPPSIVIKILMGAMKACNKQDTSHLSMSDIVKTAKVSRGTLYKYFESKDQVLIALTEYITIQFEDGLRHAAASETDPIKQFRAVLAWHDHFSSQESPDRLVLTEPEFFLGFLRDNLPRHSIALQSALTPCFDHFDKVRGRPLDREFLCELLIRIQQSRILQPTGTHWREAFAHSITGFEVMLAAPANYSRDT